jgi:catechol 2,3-dioxygenase-like lactoylglutathione lyase family enzyme
MRLGHIEIFVGNVREARDFYENVLGFSTTKIQGDGYVWMEKDGQEFLLRQDSGLKRSGNYGDSGLAIVLYTNDLQRDLKFLTSKGVEVKRFDGSENCPTFTDPYENWFQLVNPQDH